MRITVVLIRHGKTEGNLQRRYIGATNQPLSSLGISELKSFAKEGRYPKADLLVTSPMLRCLETAKLIYPSISPVVIEELKEIDFGSFEGKCYEELKDSYDYRCWVDSGGMGNQHGGEAFEAFRTRCKAGFLKALVLAKKAGESKLTLVCHGGVIMSLMEELVYPQKSFYDWQVKNGGGFIIGFDTENKKGEVVSVI